VSQALVLVAVAELWTSIGLEVAQGSAFALETLMLGLLVDIISMLCLMVCMVCVGMSTMPTHMVLPHIACGANPAVILGFNRVHQCFDTIDKSHCVPYQQYASIFNRRAQVYVRRLADATYFGVSPRSRYWPLRAI
jgi:hypothetical protein